MPPAAFLEIVSATIENGSDYDCAVLERVAGVLTTRDPAAGIEFGLLAEEQCSAE